MTPRVCSLIRPAVAAAAALVLLPAAASAAQPALPMSLPGDVTASAAAVHADPGSWIVGARPSRTSRALAVRYGAQHIGAPGTGGYAVRTRRARAFAAALRRAGDLVYAQPDTLARPLAVQSDPFSARSGFDWRTHVAGTAPLAPVVTSSSPLIALVDATADAAHPEWTGDPFFKVDGSRPVTNLHGTATASVASAPQNAIGITGVWPGARTLNVPLPDEITCRDSADQIAEAVKKGAAVINMSYGSRSLCMAEYVALQFATAKGVTLVAAAGNEFAEGNPLEFPASLPHVLTVAATDAKDRSAYFSNASAAVDLSAPGVDIETAVPPSLDEDGVKDGYQVLDGTSFAAPMVAGAAAWVRAVRPTLRADQVAQVIRLSARDVGPKGWDPVTGFGVLDVAAALTRTPPIHDPAEPNDNLVWVNGRAFSRPDDALWAGGRARQVQALLDRYEDPADVYRIVVPARGVAHVTVRDDFGRTALAAYRRDATAISDSKRRVGRSTAKVQRLSVRNPAGVRRSFYIAVTPTGTRSLDAGYTVRVGP